MADGRDDGSIAPRRSLGGPILPPPPPELADHARRAEEEKAAAARAAQEKQAAREARHAEREQARREKAAQAEQRKAEKAAAAKAASDKAAKDKLAADKAAAERTARDKTSARQAGAQRTDHGSAPERTSERTQSTSAVPSSGTSTSPATGSTSTKAGRSDRKRSAPRRTRRAQLRLVQIDAWSVMKTSFLLSIALGIVLVVAVAIIWSVLGAAGVWDSINSIVQQAVGSEQGQPFDIEKYVGTSRILGLTALVAVFDVVLITAISTLGAFLYNLSAALLGGIEVTLAEDN